MGVPVFGGNAGGTSSFLAGGSSIKFLVMITLLAEPDVEELKGSSLLAFDSVLKSKPPPKDSFPNTEAKGSVAGSFDVVTVVPPGAKGSFFFDISVVILLLLSAVLNGSVPAVTKGSLEDCLKKQSAAKGSEPLKGSPPKGSIFPKGSSLKGSLSTKGSDWKNSKLASETRSGNG